MAKSKNPFAKGGKAAPFPKKGEKAKGKEKTCPDCGKAMSKCKCK